MSVRAPTQARYRPFRHVPLFVIAMALGAGLMYLPMSYAIAGRDWDMARGFFYHGTFFLLMTLILALATATGGRGARLRSQLLMVCLVFAVLPFMLALPLAALWPAATLWGAYFEMLSCLTTTGATLLPEGEALPRVLHLWRGLTGWFGGFLMLSFAMGVFNPMGIGGFEITGERRSAAADQHSAQRRKPLGVQTRDMDLTDRLRRMTLQILPLYLSATLLLWGLIIATGADPFHSAMLAMAVISTSGISSLPAGEMGGGGIGAEIVMLPFFLIAFSRHVLFIRQDRMGAMTVARLREDSELRLAIRLVLLLSLLLYLRHFVFSFEGQALTETWETGLRAIWGALFTLTSYLSTTGFESAAWDEMRGWSGGGAASMVLIGLAIMGGGVATTAGGIKLMRFYALMLHSMREISRLNYPHSVAHGGRMGRHVRRDGAYIAWLVVMLFMVSLCAIWAILAALGIPFEEGLVLAVSALSTTGPLAQNTDVVTEGFAGVSTAAQAVLCAAMILGRLESLAVIALFNQRPWR